MLKHRKLLILAILLVAAAAIAFVLYRRGARLPEAASLLPEGDLVLYVDLQPVHLFDLGKSSSMQLEGEYKDFVDQTGIQFERDLDEVAMSRRDAPDARDTESSEIFVGRFDQDRLKLYLQKLASGTEAYRNFTIYSISHDGHLVRAALLGSGRVAVTNMASPEPMHGILDRTFSSATGPALVKEHYRDVPLGSLGWLITRISSRPDNIQLPGGFALTLPGDTVAVGSLRYTGLSLLLRADVFAQSQAQVKQIVESANTHLALVRGIGQVIKTRGPDQDIKEVFDSIQVEQKEDVAVFTATIPQSILKKIWSEAKVEAAPQAPLATPSLPQPPRR